jgi:Sulfotransferase domain
VNAAHDWPFGFGAPVLKPRQERYRTGMLRSYVSGLSKLGKPDVRAEAKLRLARVSQIPIFVSHASHYTNVYHCCIGRTASQWLRRLLSDPVVYHRSRLRTFTYQERLPGRIDTRPLTERTFERPFPKRRIVTPLYFSFENFRDLPKPERYRAFFVFRNPRDIVVSGYFLRRNTDTLGNTPEDREFLRTASLEDGLVYIIDRAERRGVFEAFRSWSDAPSEDPNVKLIRYEHLTGDDRFETIRDLTAFCDIGIHPSELGRLMDKWSFRRLTGGRRRGQADESSHYRSGVPGDWERYFTPPVEQRFNEAAGDIPSLFGYE